MARSSSSRAHSNHVQAQVINPQSHSTNSVARANNAQARLNNSQAHLNNSPARVSTSQGKLNNAQARLNSTSIGTGNLTSTSPLTTSKSASSAAVHPVATAASRAAYTYGVGSWARRYRAFGYGRGYRNRYYGGGYGYGRSQGSNRALVGRLRSVNASLSRIDHDYQGHRVRAMRAVSMAIRQLSHRSMGYGSVGSRSGMNNGMGMGRGMRQNGMGGGGRGGQAMPQAQSDARMSQNLRTLQGVGMQLGNQGTGMMGHARALGHVHQAVQELNVALSIR